ncbi:hypothetical protein WICMUC_004848 [Wickerhamomyces mucosus]|uniref:protein-histidine N-methyltransferase n=1 Tax=Wickerhamomyces mucosus TaxID=1378264 RepID=A0A9P8PE65_9ASCO|nr:hypothetical protein WICMUC_004848 [Wickerhamomyces mucosus]
MSFSFGFTQDNFSDDELVEDISSNIIEQITTNHNDHINKINPLDIINPESKPPILEDLNDLLNSLIDIRVSFETFVTPKGNVVFRRDLYDVKHQLMNEDNNDHQDNETNILLTNDSTDLTKNIYEGGFKSWECSIDTVDQLNDYSIDQLLNGNIIELGCGTSLPSTFLFNKALKFFSNQLTTNDTNNNHHHSISFILSDYNKSVLRLVTLPNLIITWANNLSIDELINLQRENNENLPILSNELQFSKSLIEKFKNDLISLNIDIKLISGSWNREFLNIYQSINSKGFNLLISSETIYSPDTLPIISELIVELFRINKSQDQPQLNTNPIGLIAAKDIYFGVGGSLVEFQNYLNLLKDQNNDLFNYETIKIDSGLKRSIVIIK